jgi:hypothetical protein
MVLMWIGIGMANLAWLFFRRPGVGFWAPAAIWWARRYVGTIGLVLWVGGFAIGVVGVVLFVLSRRT